MEPFRNRPKGNYIQEADWQSLYVLTEHWKSDLEFFKLDLDFLGKLLDKYFIWITRKENIHEVKEVIQDLKILVDNCKSLQERTSKHLTHLADLIDDPFKYDSHVFRAEHQELEDELATFVKHFRANRKTVFTVVENAIDQGKLSLLNS